MAEKYNPRAIEPKWRAQWEADGLYRTDLDASAPKYYALVMFPYTSGDLHIGHWYNFAPADAHARFQQMRGNNVFLPIGFPAGSPLALDRLGVVPLGHDASRRAVSLQSSTVSSWLSLLTADS